MILPPMITQMHYSKSQRSKGNDFFLTHDESQTLERWSIIFLVILFLKLRGASEQRCVEKGALLK